MSDRSIIPRTLTRGFERVVYAGRKITRMTFSPELSRSYWPDEARKSKARVLAELLWWLVRHGELNNYYYVYGLDRRSGVRASDFVPYRSFRRIRNRENLRTGRAPYNYVCILRDKFLFAQLLSSLGFSTPKAFALFDRTSATWLDRNVTLPLESLTGPPSLSLDGFCKRLDGIQGEGAFPLELDQGKVLVKGGEVTLDQLRNRLNGRFLFQQRIEQHPAMSALNPSSVNTVRLITFCENGKATLFSAALRVGTAGKSVDNWAAGGLIVGVDFMKGELRGEGFFKPGYGGRSAVHPDSRIQFSGFRIPYFDAAVQLVTRLHEYLRDIHSIGWDVAISTTGPTIIEGNDDWEGGIPMVLEKDFKQRFLKMYQHPSSRSGLPRSAV